MFNKYETIIKRYNYDNFQKKNYVTLRFTCCAIPNIFAVINVGHEPINKVNTSILACKGYFVWEKDRMYINSTLNNTIKIEISTL